MTDQGLRSGSWVTPAGHQVTMEYRDGTSDWNTLSSILTHDEYGMPRDRSGLMVDVGAHIGGWAIGMARDNPAATVVAIEALPENAALIERNASLNRLAVRVLNVAAGDIAQIAYGTTEDEFQRHHFYIGGAVWQDTPSRKVITLATFGLHEVVATYGPVDLLKIDCEGCEWSFLDDVSVSEVREIVGEYHPRNGHGPARIRELLEGTHDVTLDDNEPFGIFRAVRR